jgi:hypothetical protein
LRRWGSKDKSLDNLSDRLEKLEEERGEVKPVEDSDTNDRPYATAEELEQMSSMEKYIAWFNWYVRRYVLRYLERVADHACYIADSSSYIVTGKSNPRRVHMNP